jgi:hypothetical protein
MFKEMLKAKYEAPGAADIKVRELYPPAGFLL